MREEYTVGKGLAVIDRFEASDFVKGMLRNLFQCKIDQGQDARAAMIETMESYERALPKAEA